jgi:predicted outer membrane repeat protein
LCRNALAYRIVLLCAVAIPAHATTITVTNTNDSGAGSLRQALADASDGDIITFAATGSIELSTGELLVNKSITISGPGAANLVVDGNARSRVFYIASDQTVSITGLTVTNGIATTNDGGGIYNDHAALALNNCTITGNQADYGGGIYNDGFSGSATLEISNSAIYGNTAMNTGGSIYNDGTSSGNASLTISSSMLTANSARFGGGIHNNGFDFGNAILTVNNSTFSGNSADFGGCIYNDSFIGNASLTLNDSTMSGNSAHDAGGCIYNGMVFGFGTQTLNNSTLSGNSAGNSGGAIYSDHAEGIRFTLNGCTISGNSAQNWGGGIYNDGSGFNSAWLTIDSSTLNGNSAATGGGIYNDGEQQGDTHLQISNSTVSENTASDGGGLASSGYDAYYVRVTISNSTFSGNSASNAGGGIYNVGQSDRDTVLVTLTNTILKSGPLGGTIFCNSTTISSLGYNLSDDSCGGFLTGPGDQTNTDPMLGPLQDNGGPTLTHALLLGSPAINAGDPNFTPPPLYDQRGPGFDRVVNGRIDSGSFEMQTATPISLSASKRKVRGINTVQLAWSGATSANIDVYRDGVLIVTTANDGSYIDSTGDTGRARYRYRVCEAGTGTCSNDVRVTFRQ